MNNINAFLLVLTVNLLLVTSAFAQSRFSIAPTVTPGYRSMHFNYQTAGSGIGFQLNGSGSYRTVTGGLMVSYTINKEWSVSTGLVFSRFIGSETFHYVNSTIPVEELGGAGDEVQLPVLINYTTSRHRLSPYLSAGAVLNYTSADPVAYYSIYQQTHLADILFVPAEPPKKVRTQALIGAGVQYRLTPAVAVIVQPTAACEFGKPTGDYSQYRVYQFGVQTQLKCTF